MKKERTRKERYKRKRQEQPFNVGNIDKRNIARAGPNATASFKRYQRCRARDAQLLASADVDVDAVANAHARVLDRL